jgi:hypothetical protein
VFLVVILPIGLGLLIPSRLLAVGIWLIVVTIMARSQAGANGLEGAWPVVVILGVLEISLVFLGASLRRRRVAARPRRVASRQ